MSFTSKLALLGSITFAGGIITYVHFRQKEDRQSLREGVIKDIQRQQMKKRQNLKDLQDQIELTKILTAQRDIELKKEGLSSSTSD